MRDEVFQALNKDPKIKALIAILEPKPLHLDDNLYVSLVHSIVSQQVSTAAARSIYGRLTGLFDMGIPDPESVLSLSDHDLRGVGLSRQKASYIKNISEYFTPEKRGFEYWYDMRDEDIISALTSIKGVGLWTAQMILIFSLGREDVFPSKDLGIQNGMKKLYNWKDEGKELIAKMERKAKKWQPYRSYGSRLIWQSLAPK